MGTQFLPDYAVPPGDTLRDVLEDRGITQADLAVRIELAEKTISQIINGLAPLSCETADKLEMALGIPARFWNTRELHFREASLRLHDEKKHSEANVWLKEIPVSVLVERGFVEKSKNIATTARSVLSFFGVSSVSAWRNAWQTPCCQYRVHDARKRKPGFVAAWLRMGELLAEKVPSQPFDAKQFRDSLREIKQLTKLPVAKRKKELQERCALAGVAVVVVKELPGAAVSGVAKWLSKDKALIQLSLQYKTEDQFWFTFFHEAGHICLHSKKEVFVDGGSDADDDFEREANSFARDILIPPRFASRLPSLKSKAEIVAFAESVGVAPGIVVGRLQHDGVLKPRLCDNLKTRFAWQDTPKK